MTINEIPDSSWTQMEEMVPERAGGRQIRIGMFVLGGLIASIYLLFLLTDPATFRGRYKITTVVENVMGLRKGDPVQMRGVTIGKVHDFEMAREGENVVITLEIEGQWLIPEGSRTQLVSPGLMAPRTVEVLPGLGPGTIGRGGSLPGTVVKGLVPISWTQRFVLENVIGPVQPEAISRLIDAFHSSGGGSCGPGCIILFASPFTGQEAPAFVFEGDRFGGVVRLLPGFILVEVVNLSELVLEGGEKFCRSLRGQGLHEAFALAHPDVHDLLVESGFGDHPAIIEVGAILGRKYSTTAGNPKTITTRKAGAKTVDSMTTDQIEARIEEVQDEIDKAKARFDPTKANKLYQESLALEARLPGGGDAIIGRDGRTA
ncbi:MAG: MCE family protein [Proteobacteria bacterium]|nr:MCE family protein [Pseudomonadota bacterium]